MHCISPHEFVQPRTGRSFVCWWSRAGQHPQSHSTAGKPGKQNRRTKVWVQTATVLQTAWSGSRTQVGVQAQSILLAATTLHHFSCCFSTGCELRLMCIILFRLFKIQGKTQEDLAAYRPDMTLILSNIFSMISMQFTVYYCILMNYWNLGCFFFFFFLNKD